MILYILIFFIGLFAGFFMCAVVTAEHVSGLEDALARFASPRNWKLVVDDEGNIWFAWNSDDNPQKVAEEAMR